MTTTLNCPFCDRSISAPDSWLGQNIHCPHCSEPFLAQPPAESDGIRDSHSAAAESDWQEDEDDDEYELQADEAPPADAPPEAASRDGTCPQCGASLGEDGLYCEHCRYHVGLKRKLSGDVEIEESQKPKGLLEGQLAEPEDASSTVYLAWAFLLLILFMASIQFYPWGLAVTIPIVLLAGLTHWTLAKKKASDSDSLEPSGLVAGRIWNWSLAYMRASGWRGSDLKKLQTVSVKNTDFTDTDLAELAEPETLEVLDAEATQLTDDSIAQLCQMRKLKFLVIRETAISRAGAERIRKRLPDIRIWHA